MSQHKCKSHTLFQKVTSVFPHVRALMDGGSLVANVTSCLQHRARGLPADLVIIDSQGEMVGL